MFSERERSDFELDFAEAGSTNDRGSASGSTATEQIKNNSEGSNDIMVGIPAYNEADSIADVVASVAVYADEVIVVDDGSEDETSERALVAGATVVTHERNRGYGGALSTIFAHARAAGAGHLVVLDGDGQHDPADIPVLVDTQRETGAEIVIGSRFVGNSNSVIPSYRYFGIAVVNAITNLSMRLKYSPLGLSDTQSGFRAYGKDAIETIADTEDIGHGMDASLDILFHAAQEGYDIKEVPSEVDYEVQNPSTINPVVHGLALVRRLIIEFIPTWNS